VRSAVPRAVILTGNRFLALWRKSKWLWLNW